MRPGTQHLAGATMLLCLVFVASRPSWAQDETPCPTEDLASDTYPAEDLAGDLVASAPCQPSVRERICACAAGCCQGFHISGKRCRWYRPYTEASQPDVFYNFYVPNTRGDAAAAYPAPYPTPSLVGHTYYTYQPLMPHEFLYRHHRTYHQYYNQGMGMNRTSVHWYGTPLRTTARSIRHFLTLPR